jgi:hypothetical protein
MDMGMTAAAGLAAVQVVASGADATDLEAFTGQQAVLLQILADAGVGDAEECLLKILSTLGETRASGWIDSEDGVRFLDSEDGVRFLEAVRSGNHTADEVLAVCAERYGGDVADRIVAGLRSAAAPTETLGALRTLAKA